MAKTEVYSWRLSPRLKIELEEAARNERKSLSELLQQIAEEWLARSRDLGEDEEERQRRLHAAADKLVGAFAGGDPHRAERSRDELRSRIARRHGR